MRRAANRRDDPVGIGSVIESIRTTIGELGQEGRQRGVIDPRPDAKWLAVGAIEKRPPTR